MRKKTEDKLWFGFMVLMGAIIIFVLLVSVWQMSPWGCDSRWDIDTDWSITAGCRVMTTEGWVPEDSYRVLP